MGTLTLALDIGATRRVREGTVLYSARNGPVREMHGESTRGSGKSGGQDGADDLRRCGPAHGDGRHRRYCLLSGVGFGVHRAEVLETDPEGYPLLARMVLETSALKDTMVLRYDWPADRNSRYGGR